MRVNAVDNVDIGGHFADIVGEAQRNHASRISIQSYYTFCGFKTLQDAEAFEAWCRASGKETNGVNRERSYTPYEVAVHHHFESKID